jgi:hypothetical protein
MANDSKRHRDSDYFAGVAAAIVLGFLIGVAVTPSKAETSADSPSSASDWSADYFPAQFTIRSAADQGDEPIPTF